MMRAVTLKTDLNVERKKTSVFCKSVFLSPFGHFKGQEGKDNEPCSLFSADENRYMSSYTCAVLCCVPPTTCGGGRCAERAQGQRPSFPWRRLPALPALLLILGQWLPPRSAPR